MCFVSFKPEGSTHTIRGSWLVRIRREQNKDNRGHALRRCVLEKERNELVADFLESEVIQQVHFVNDEHRNAITARVNQDSADMTSSCMTASSKNRLRWRSMDGVAALSALVRVYSCNNGAPNPRKIPA